jgi:hypothetical protein
MRPLAEYDRYDWIGLALILFLATLWIAHFVFPDGGPPAPV